MFVATDRCHLDAVVRDGDRWVIAEPDADGSLRLDALDVTMDADALYDGVELDDASPRRDT